jgi:hypothetical protein
MQTFPEVDRADWFDLETARGKLVHGQVALLGVLVRTLSPAANRADRATQPIDVAAGSAGDRCEPGRLLLVALSRWP